MKHKITKKHRDEIAGAMGGWEIRSEHTIVSVGPTNAKGQYVAVVKFTVDPRRKGTP